MSPLARKRQSGVTLIELLVVMVIMSIVSGMVIMVWFSLSNASAFTTKSNEQQDFAREATSRMAAEIRDAEDPASSSSSTAFTLAAPDEIRLYTTFNQSGAADPATKPTLQRFILWSNGCIYREAADSSGNFAADPSQDSKAQLLVSNVVNSQNSRDLFVYSAYNSADGKLYYSDSATNVTVAPEDIVTVTITVLVDLNPGHSPQYVTVQTTVQPRNMLRI
jgi:prepilin-type N-terminal cleavage/methylation domain-containing protein